MEKTIVYPTDDPLYERAGDQLVTLVQQAGVELRHFDARLGPRLALKVGWYAHAKKFKRIRRALKKQKGYKCRVMRDFRRHLQDIPEGSLRQRIIAKLALVSQLLHQAPEGADKIYTLHEPQVDCISKGKARGYATNSAARSVSLPRWKKAPLWACAVFQAIPPMAILSARRWNRSPI